MKTITREEKFRIISENFKEYIQRRTEEDRLQNVFYLSEDDVKFLNGLDFYNVSRSKKKGFEVLEATYEGNEYFIIAYLDEKYANAVLKSEGKNTGLKKIFWTGESKVILFHYILDSGILTSLASTRSKKIE